MLSLRCCEGSSLDFLTSQDSEYSTNAMVPRNRPGYKRMCASVCACVYVCACVCACARAITLQASCALGFRVGPAGISEPPSVVSRHRNGLHLHSELLAGCLSCYLHPFFSDSESSALIVAAVQEPLLRRRKREGCLPSELPCEGGPEGGVLNVGPGRR